MCSDPHKHAPIAIYDSGVGGLAIARAIKALLPQEPIHYIGDTKNLPYGEKGSMALCGYITQVVNFCLTQGYKLLVMACNTATAAADDFSYLKTIGQEIPVINVIDPVVDYIHATNRYKQIGLIGTKYTVASGIYARRLGTTEITLTALATPLLVPMVEAHFNGGQIDHDLLDHYLNQITHLDALIPACTHYLFLEKALKRFYFDEHRSAPKLPLEKGFQKRSVEVIDVAKLTASAVKQWLTEHDLLNDKTKKLPDCFMATALTPAFQNATKQLFGQSPIEVDLMHYTHAIDLTLSH